MATFGCASKQKKKAAAADEWGTKWEDSAPKWESAGETLPPEKPPPPPAAAPPPAPATAAAPNAPAAAPGKGAPPSKVEPAPAKGAAPKPAAVAAATPAKAAAPGGRKPSDAELIAPINTLDAPFRASKPEPKAEAPKSEPKPEPIARAETKPEPKPEPKEPPPKAEGRRDEPEPMPKKPSPYDDERPERGDRSPDRTPPKAAPEDAPVELPASAKRGDLRGLIGGKRIVFRRGVILGNRKHGYALQAFESHSTSSKSGEVNARIDGELAKGRVLPITLIFLQVPDDGPKSDKGVRTLTCQGRGALMLDTLPPLPKRLPKREEVEAGDAEGAVSIQVICTRDAREYGAFAIEGRLGSKVVITPPDI